MTGGAWRVTMIGLAAAAAALAYLGVDVLRLSGGGAGLDGGNGLLRGDVVLDMAAAGIGLIALWIAFAKLSRHFRDLDRLREQFTGGGGRLGGGWASSRGDEVGLLARSAAGLSRSERTMPGRLDKSVAALLALNEAPVLLLDERGRIERLNAAAARLLNVGEGADIGQSLNPTDLQRAIERARGDGETTSAVLRRSDDGELSARIVDLGLGAGVALAFPVRLAAGATGAGGKRILSLRPPVATEPLGDDEPLAALPFVALWVATAGVEPGEGPVVAVGTVRLAGARVFRTVSLSVLVDPAAPIPAEATARHGIATADVAGERPFVEAWPSIADALHHCVVVGVGVEAALASLARAYAQAGLPPPALPSALDLGVLAGALDPALAGATLDGLADAFALPAMAGPFGPVLRQAELAAALLVRLDARGITTHGQARALLAGASA